MVLSPYFSTPPYKDKTIMKSIGLKKRKILTEKQQNARLIRLQKLRDQAEIQVTKLIDGLLISLLIAVTIYSFAFLMWLLFKF